MKVTIDTTAVVSGIFWKRDSHTILNLVASGDLDNVISDEIFEEYEDVCLRDKLLEKTEQDAANIKASLSELKKFSTFVKPKTKFDAVKDDPKDNKFLDAAFEGKADYIITRDKKHLLKLKKFKGIKIVEPEQFLKLEFSRFLPDFIVETPQGTYVFEAKTGKLRKRLNKLE